MLGVIYLHFVYDNECESCWFVDAQKTPVLNNKPLDKINSQKCLCPNNLTNVVLLLFFIEQKQNGILVVNFGQTNFSPLQIWCVCVDSLSRTINNEQIR